MLPVIFFIIWLYTIYVFKKNKLYFFYFVVGSSGFFIFMMYFGLKQIKGIFSDIVIKFIALVGNLTQIYETIPESYFILLNTKGSIITFVLDYECSGFIETLVYLSILIFFTRVSVLEKLKYSLFGIIFILSANVLRVTFICVLIKVFGESVIYLSHTVFARVLFFMLIIWLYYNTFTKLQIKYQQVGMHE